MSKLLVALIGAFFGITSICDGAETIKIRADEWMPYNGTPSGENPGFVIEILQEIFTPQGIQIDYQNMPWTEALQAAKTDEIDGVIGADHEEGAGLSFPEESIGQPRFSIFVTKNNPWSYENASSLKQIKLGAIKGYTYWDAMDVYIARGGSSGLTLFEGNTPLQDAMAQLDSGKIGAMVETYSVFLWTLKISGRDKNHYRPAFTFADGEPMYVAFKPSADGKRYAKLFSEGIRALRAKGRLAEILKRYGQQDWK